MNMTFRSNLVTALAILPMLAACPVTGDLGDSSDGANNDGGDDAGDDAGSTGKGGDTGSATASAGATDTGGPAESGDSGGGDPCDTPEECGPAPGAPSFLCDDGVTVGGPGPCQELEDGTCGYPWIECPACCAPADEPQCFEGATCCADGTWACNDGVGQPDCPSGVGTECACCDPAGADELGCIEGASCCADGSWACDDGAGGSTCPDPGVECSGGTDVCAEDGASCAGGETCCEGTMCCAGVPVPAGDEYCSAMCPISDRERKENFQGVDPELVLDKVLSMPLSTWNYKFEDKTVRHIGPMAQDFIATFEVGSTDKAIYTVDADGVAFASIKALHGQIETLQSENTALQTELQSMRRRLDALETK